MKKRLLSILLVLLVVSCAMPPGLASGPPDTGQAAGWSPPRTVDDLLEQATILKIGSHVAAVEVGVTALYPGERDVVPYIKDGCTYVPLRFIAERLGATVGWDNDTQTAVVELDDHTLLVPIGSAQYTLDGVAHPLDAPTELVHDRTMVALNFFSDALGCTTDRDDANSLVAIAPAALGWTVGGDTEADAFDKALDIMLMYGSFV